MIHPRKGLGLRFWKLLLRLRGLQPRGVPIITNKPWEVSINYNNKNSGNQAGSTMMYSPSQNKPKPNPAPSPSTPTTRAPNYIPAYIASLPINSSNPYAIEAPFALLAPTPNLKMNLSNNHCGYGWEHANAKCLNGCPSGQDSECPEAAPAKVGSNEPRLKTIQPFTTYADEAGPTPL
mmetsp:Transcript_35393/g.74713  ORF Transcript_35393/g.74713 Transcript_35393/m.74713 type:complete len:178 (-) Transcript_35393:220-753(-)